MVWSKFAFVSFGENILNNFLRAENGQNIFLNVSRLKSSETNQPAIRFLFDEQIFFCLKRIIFNCGFVYKIFHSRLLHSLEKETELGHNQ